MILEALALTLTESHPKVCVFQHKDHLRLMWPSRHKILVSIAFIHLHGTSISVTSYPPHVKNPPMEPPRTGRLYCKDDINRPHSLLTVEAEIAAIVQKAQTTEQEIGDDS